MALSSAFDGLDKAANSDGNSDAEKACQLPQLAKALREIGRIKRPLFMRDRVQEIRRGLAGNLCRCTGYQMIVDTVRGCEKEEE